MTDKLGVVVGLRDRQVEDVVGLLAECGLQAKDEGWDACVVYYLNGDERGVRFSGKVERDVAIGRLVHLLFMLLSDDESDTEPGNDA